MLQETFLNILSDALFHPEKKNDDEFSSEVWNEIYEESINHSIAPIIFDAIYTNESLPQELYSAWKKYSMLSQIKWFQMMKLQKEFLDILKTNGVTAVVIKGATAARYYRNPSQRLSSDIDVIVSQEDYDRAYDILLNNGYEAIGELNYHREVIKDNTAFELHHTLPKLPKGKIGKRTYELIQSGICNSEEIAISSFQVRSYPSLQNGIVLLRHILQHMVKGIGLRQIIDWMMYVNEELDDEAWKLLKKEYELCGLSETAINVTRMCQRYLGLRTEGITWCMGADDEVGDLLIQYVLAKGNLGVKELNNDSEKGVLVFSRDKGLFTFIKRLQEHGVANWDACHQWWILRPFAWLHTIIRYSKYVASRNDAAHQLFADIDVGRSRNRLFRSIGCFNSKLYDQRDITR